MGKMLSKIPVYSFTGVTDVAMGGGYSGIVQMGTSNPSSPRINPPLPNWKFSWMT